MQTAPPLPRARISKLNLMVVGSVIDGWMGPGEVVSLSDPSIDSLRRQAVSGLFFCTQRELKAFKNALREGLSESEPENEDRELYNEQLSRLTQWTQQLDSATSRKRSRSVTSPPSMRKKLHAAVSMNNDITGELRTIEGSGESLTEGSRATKDAKKDVDGGIREMMGIDGPALDYLPDTVGVEVEDRDVEMLDEGYSEADAGVEAWNMASIEAMASSHLEENPEARDQARQYLAASYYDHIVSTVQMVSKAMRENE